MSLFFIQLIEYLDYAGIFLAFFNSPAKLLPNKTPGLIMKKDLFILLFIFLSGNPLTAESVLYPVNISGKWGFINTSGKLFVPAVYDTVRKFHDNITAVGKANSKGYLRYGYIDTSGKSILKPVYLSVSDFSCGIGVIVKDDVKKSVFCVNNKGVSIHSFPLLSATVFTNGLSIIKFYDETNYRICDGILSNNGAILTNRFEKLIGVSEGLILVQTKIPVIGPDNMITSSLEKKGFVDMSGEVVIGTRFDDARVFQNGLAAVSLKDDKGVPHWGFIDKNGILSVQPRFDNVGDFIGGFAPVMVSNKWGYVTDKDILKIPAVYPELGPFIDGLGIWYSGGYFLQGKWIPKATGILNEWGPIFEISFNEVIRLDNGIFAGRILNKWGYFNKWGLFTGIEYDAVSAFSCGLAAVNKGNYWYYIATNGAVILADKYSAVTPFEYWHAAVLKNYNTGGLLTYIDSKGKPVWSKAYDMGYPFKKGEILTVMDAGGVKLLKSAKTNAKTLAAIPYGAAVKVAMNQGADVLNNPPGHGWVKITYAGKTGFAADGAFTKLPLPVLHAPGAFQFRDYLYYTVGVIDTGAFKTAGEHNEHYFLYGITGIEEEFDKGSHYNFRFPPVRLEELLKVFFYCEGLGGISLPYSGMTTNLLASTNVFKELSIAVTRGDDDRIKSVSMIMDAGYWGWDAFFTVSPIDKSVELNVTTWED